MMNNKEVSQPNNKNLTLLLLAFSFMIITGCTKPFQPPPPEYKLWEKSGATELDIKKALLECGEPSIHPRGNDYELAFKIKSFDEERNLSFLASKCMENAGFIPLDYNVESLCKHKTHQHLPVCQPGAQIPKPSVERRLNSWYCQKNRINVKKCQNKELDPFICKDGYGYTKILPECKP